MPEQDKNKKDSSKNYLGHDPASSLQALDDYLLGPNGWSGQRSGITTQLAKAQGKDPSFNLRHPITSEALGSALYGAGGGLAGMGLGKLITPQGTDASANTRKYGLIGGTVGVLANLLQKRMSRRSESADVINDYKAGVPFVDNPDPKFSALGSAFNALGGSHRLGQAEAYRMLNKGKQTPSYSPSNPTLVNASHIADKLFPAAGPFPGIARSLSARDMVQQEQEEKSAAYYLGFELGYNS